MENQAVTKEFDLNNLYLPFLFQEAAISIGDMIIHHYIDCGDIFRCGRILHNLTVPSRNPENPDWKDNPLWEHPEIFRDPVEKYTGRRFNSDIKDFDSFREIVYNISQDFAGVGALPPEHQVRLRTFCTGLSRKVFNHYFLNHPASQV